MATSIPDLQPGSPSVDATAPDRETRRELRLFALMIALALMVIATRAQILRIAHLKSHYPLLFYQDILALVVLGGGLHFALRLVRRWRIGGRIVEITGWSLCLFLALYTSIAAIVFWYIRSPLTYRLILLSDSARGVQASVRGDLTGEVLSLPANVLLVVVLAYLLWRCTPHLLHQLHSKVYSVSGVAVIGLYVIGSHLWVTRHVHFISGVENPEWAFIESVVQAPRPTVTGSIPSAYFEDFHPAVQPKDVARDKAFSALPRVPASGKPMNVILFVMESVGAKNLQLTGAPYPDSPVMEQLAAHGIVYDNTYVSQPFSSAAMAGMFASLYPDHDWKTLPRQEPTIRVPGLPAVLKAHGYQSAFVHGGLIDFDGNLSFLENAGFDDVIARSEDDIRPRDGELVPATFNWIRHHQDHPFFVAIWTRDTHNPYLSPNDHKYTDERVRNRYLNSIAWTDQVIGQLTEELKREGLVDNTLLVITGDHGEAFEEHGQSVHNFSVYNEEVRIPLMFVNPALIPNRIDRHDLARQLDIAPTILDVLGIDQPAAWQGTSLFAAKRPTRAYLFSIAGDFRLGLAEGDYVYIQNYTRDRHELYNVRNDFDEAHDLSSDPQFASMMARDRLRLEAWLAFQNKYLESFACAGCPVPHRAAESLEEAAATKPPEVLSHR
ncbi:MAG TPA: sulfatase [Candidatus Binataceae bacterium]|nr:sulfatase [Candidatus Binataceae bacterium]